MLRTSNQFRHQTESGTKRSRRASNEVVLASIHRQILVPFYEIQIQTQIQLQILMIDKKESWAFNESAFGFDATTNTT